MVNIAIYTRVSTDDQAQEGFSLSAQRERLEAYCSAQGWTIYNVFEEFGYSGRNIKRPCYQQMLTERDNWDMILVLKMDRIHRNSRNFMEMMDALKRWGKEFSSMLESLDTSTAMGRFVVDIIQRIAQLESEQIGERVYTGMKQKAISTKGILGSRIPFGYKLENSKYIIKQSEAEVVKHIFNEYQNNKSFNKIASELNDKGVLTRNNKPWTVWNISYILHNPVYAGFLRWDDVVNKWSNVPIVSEGTFNKVQELLTSRRKNQRSRKKMLKLQP